MKRFAQNHLFYTLFTLLLVTSSCVKEMDFGGVKDITLEPTMEIRLMEAGVTTEEMIIKLEKFAEENGIPKPYPSELYKTGLPTIEKVAAVDITSEEEIIKYLDSTALDFSIINTTPRDIKIKVILLMENNSEIDSFEKISIAGTSEPAKVYLYFNSKEEIEKLKKLTKVKVEITLHSGADLRTDQTGKFELTGKGLFNFNYDVSDGLP